MEVIGLQSAIWANRRKTILLLLLFPILIFGVVWAIFTLFALFPSSNTHATQVVNSAPFWLLSLGNTLQVFTFLGPLILVWALISFWFHKQIIFAFSGAKAIERKDYPEIYNIVENLCISRGLATPKI